MRKGVTLIELLIVITIIAVLAGAAIPYVQDYLDQSKYARAKADLDEIKAALARYEVDRGDYPNPPSTTGIASLVGPYLSKALVDPWGAPYVVQATASQIYSYGPDGATGTDDVVESFRPPLAVSQVFWIDSNNDGVVQTTDSIHIRYTRSVQTLGASIGTIKGSAVNAGTFVDSSNRISSSAVPVAFVPGKDILTIPAGTTCVDGSGVKLRLDTVTIKAR